MYKDIYCLISHMLECIVHIIIMIVSGVYDMKFRGDSGALGWNYILPPKV
jgi:hypothetical protein